MTNTRLERTLPEIRLQLQGIWKLVCILKTLEVPLTSFKNPSPLLLFPTPTHPLHDSFRVKSNLAEYFS